MINHPRRNLQNAKAIERIDIHGRILWLPALKPDVAIAWRALVERTIAESPDWDHCAEILDICGIPLILNVEHHGPQNYLIWSLGYPRRETWALARLAEIEA
jgi:hypothetical protein